MSELGWGFKLTTHFLAFWGSHTQFGSDCDNLSWNFHFLPKMDMPSQTMTSTSELIEWMELVWLIAVAANWSNQLYFHPVLEVEGERKVKIITCHSTCDLPVIYIISSPRVIFIIMRQSICALYVLMVHKLMSKSHIHQPFTSHTVYNHK